MAKIATASTGRKSPQIDLQPPLSTAPGCASASPSRRAAGKGSPNINRTFAPIIGAPPTGLDKVVLTSTDYRVRDIYAARLTGHLTTKYCDGKGTASPHLLTDDRGHAVTASKLFDNSGPAQIDIDHRGLRVILNPSKLAATAGGLLCTDPRDLRTALDMVADDLADRGILADLDRFNLARLDLTRDGHMTRSVATFQPLFNLLSMTRATKAATYPGGYMTGKGPVTLIMYNKGLEAGLDRDDILRGELQLNSKGKGKANRLHSAGLYTLADVRAAGFDGFRDIYRNVIRAEVFTADDINLLNSQVVLPVADLEAELELLETIFTRRSVLTRWLQVHSAAALLNRANTEQILAAVRARGFHRNRVRDFERKLRDMATASARLRADVFGNLYRELVANFAA